MQLGGLQKLSLIDYPGQISAIIFTYGCNFRCHFCHNPKLVVPAPPRTRSGAGPQKDYLLPREDSLFGFLAKRRNKLDAVVITGGEPTLHQDLPRFISKIKDLGFLVKLDTNGANPEMLKYLIEKKLINYIAMDLKAPLEKYEKVTGVRLPLNNIKKSIKIIRESNLPYEFRTTVVPVFHQAEDIKKMGELIKGADKWFLQTYHPENDVLNPAFKKKKPYTDKQMNELLKIAKRYATTSEVR